MAAAVTDLAIVVSDAAGAAIVVSFVFWLVRASALFSFLHFSFAPLIPSCYQFTVILRVAFT